MGEGCLTLMRCLRPCALCSDKDRTQGPQKEVERSRERNVSMGHGITDR